MKNFILIIFSIVLCGTGSQNTFAQDVHFSQFDQTPLIINPAYAGAMNGDYRIITNYRNQWKSIPSTYSTIMGSYDMAVLRNKIYNGFIGIGVSAYSDKAGDLSLKTSSLNLSISSNLTLSEHQYLAIGLQAGYGTKGIDNSTASWGSQFGSNGYDPQLPDGESYATNQFGFADIGTGIAWFYNSSDRAKTVGQDQFKMNAGISVFHLNKPKNSFLGSDSKLSPKIVFATNVKYEIANAPVSIMPGVLYSLQGKQYELLLGSNIKYQINDNTKYTGLVSEAAVYFGIWGRINDAIILSSGFLYSGIRIGFSYDINLSALKIASQGRGGFEISLSYRGTFSTGKIKQNKARFE
jgi:type IX secretion system PorP/SprF family membrane protein